MSEVPLYMKLVPRTGVGVQLPLFVVLRRFAPGSFGVAYGARDTWEGGVTMKMKQGHLAYKKMPPPRPYSRPIHGAQFLSWGGGRFL